ncbi:RNA polymerase sigma factor [Candidatus Leptofilum sp.]|uniref:RNA polymerase sigma factor n=1 Tax=Candidatus Leptofilum sp. TaxID=3241576 RepID=UPI003B5A81AE
MSIVLPFGKQQTAVSIDWNALYADHIGRIFNFFRYRVGDEATAEDLTAVTFEKAWVKRQQFRGDADSFVHWLYAIARNVANDHYRKRPDTVALDEIVTLATSTNLNDVVAKKIEFAQLVHAISQLPARERDVITLKYGAALNNRQIARQLRLSESNVGSILHCTIHKLRRKMEDKDE